MKPRKKTKSKRKVIRVWTYPQARKALPYITSVMGSLRENWLEAQRHLLLDKRLAQKPGRLDRATILARQDAAQAVEQAKDKFNEVFQELQNIEVYCIDPNQGMAALPFVQEDRLAWLLYDFFAPEEFQNWRFHDDPLETRRPIAEANTEGPANKPLVV